MSGSWRATPSRPAPPVTSTTSDSLFGPSTPNSRPTRTISSSSSALSLLARQKAEMDDDRMSIMSGRSGTTLNGRRWELSIGEGRRRADSSASSIRTTRSTRTTMSSRTTRERKSIMGDGDVDMGSDSDAGPSSPPREAVTAPSKGPAVETAPVVKRQRLNGDPRIPRKSSWLASPGKAAIAAPSADTSTSPLLSAVIPATAPVEPPPLSLDNETPPPPKATPSARPSSSLAFVRAPEPPPSEKSAPIEPAPVAAPESIPSTAPVLRAKTTSAPPSIRRSWFGRSYVAEDPTATPEEPTRTSLESIPDVEVASPEPAPATAPVDPRPASIASVESTNPPSAPPPQHSTLAQASSRGWLSSFSLSRTGSMADIPTEANASAVTSGSEIGSGSADSSAMEGVETYAEADATPAPTPTNGDGNGTIKGQSTPDYDDATLTPRPSRQHLPSLKNQRSYWWGWSSSSVDTDTTPTAETAPVLPLEDDQEMSIPDDPEREATPQPTLPPPPETKSWLRTIWGEFPDEAEARRKAAALQQRLPEITASASQDDSSHNSDAPSSLSPTASTSSLTSLPALPAPIVPAPVQNLKHKASWGFFPSRSASASFAPSSPTHTTANPTPPGSAPQSYGKPSPIGLAVASSAASARSQASTDNNSAPNSPYLAAQPDGPVKPLTGSVRSSPRPGPFEPDPPFENLVLPTFNDTFGRAPRNYPPRQSTLNKAVSIVSAYLFHQPASPEIERVKDDPAEKLPKSLETMSEPPRLDRVRRVVTIGVHGWFPNPRLKSVFGEPTGTSVKFATMMHDAVHSYLEANHPSGSFNIQAIALEGQGMVQDRINLLYSQLIGRSEWVEALHKADAVFLATHSQGSVVSTQLLARMLDHGLIVGAKTHMLAMCAIAQGPFVYLSQSFLLSPYFSYIESAPARELFEFQDPESSATIKFLDALRTILASGVKITTVGSINDQVVPLYSALFSGVSHPGILRAVYIDSDAFRTSDFLANLVVFAARLRNAGLKDHDLVEHVSEALAGALTGVGHSKIYEEEEVFSLAVRYHFETTTLHESPTFLDLHAPPGDALSMKFNPRERRNPYLLTWSLRGIIEDAQVRELFGNELAALREAFESWRPATKILKETKLKLAGIQMLPIAKSSGKL